MATSLRSMNHTACNKNIMPCKSYIKNKRSVPVREDRLIYAPLISHYLSGVPAQRSSKVLLRNALLKKRMQDASKTCIISQITWEKLKPSRKANNLHKNKNSRSMRLYNKAAGAVKTLHSTWRWFHKSIHWKTIVKWKHSSSDQSKEKASSGGYKSSAQISRTTSRSSITQ